MADRLAWGVIGFHLGGNTDPGALARRARLAEEVGLESLWVGTTSSCRRTPDRPRHPGWRRWSR